MLKLAVSEEKLKLLVQRMASCGIREEDLKETFIKSSGPGGQKTNVTSSCVLLLHVPSGIRVKMQKERSQSLNRYYARKRLCEIMELERGGKDSQIRKKIEKIKKQKDRKARRGKKAKQPSANAPQE